MSRYNIKFDARTVDALKEQVEDAAQIALLNTMVRFHIETNPLVPIDTGQLRESFEYNFVSKNEIVGEWEAWKNDFPYGAYQYENHKTMRLWVLKSIEQNKEKLIQEFKSTMERELK